MEVAVNTVGAETRKVLRNSFVWMTFGLAITALISWVTAETASLTQIIIDQPVVSLVSLGVWVVLGLGFGFFVRHVPYAIGVVLFTLYSTFTGVALSWIFTAYTDVMILNALVSTIGLFAVITVFALYTSVDLTRWWMYILFAILGVVLASVINIFFFRSEGFELVLSLIAVVIFSISTAASVQKIAKMEHELAPRLHNRAGIIGAMMLYTNFINLFLRLLELYARTQNNKNK